MPCICVFHNFQRLWNFKTPFQLLISHYFYSVLSTNVVWFLPFFTFVYLRMRSFFWNDPPPEVLNLWVLTLCVGIKCLLSLTSPKSIRKQWYLYYGPYQNYSNEETAKLRLCLECTSTWGSVLKGAVLGRLKTSSINLWKNYACCWK